MTSNLSWTIAIGASGGEGLRNLCELLVEWDDLNVSVLIALHRPWAAASYLREVLQRSSRMPVSIAGEGQALKPGCVYIGEPNSHLRMISGTHGFLTFDPERRYGNRTVDLLFRSLAEFGAPHVIGIVLEGSLDDGSRGLEAIHHAGGCTMVITPSKGTPGMPQNAIRYGGPIDMIGDIPTIARAIEAAVS